MHTHTQKHSQRKHNMLDQVQSPFISILTLLRSKGRDLGDRSMIHFLDISIFADHKWSCVKCVWCFQVSSSCICWLQVLSCVCWWQVPSSHIYMLANYKWHPPVSWLQALSFHVCWLHMSFCLLVTSIVLLHWLLSSYVCWLQVTSSCFLITRIVLQCLLVTRVVLQCSLIKSIVLLCWLVANVVLLCLLTASAVLCFLATSVVLCLLITSAVLCLLIKSAVLCLLITSSVLYLLITNTVRCLLITSAVLRWLITSAILNSYACWLQVFDIDNKCCPPM